MRDTPKSSMLQVKKLESAKVKMKTSSKAGTHNFWNMSSSTSDSTWTVAARGALAAKVTKMASKFSGVHPEFQRSLVTQIQLPMRVLMRIDPDFARPTATAIPMALPLREKRHYGKYLMKSVQKVGLLYQRSTPLWHLTQPNVMYLLSPFPPLKRNQHLSSP